jgi:hypothetical protein
MTVPAVKKWGKILWWDVREMIGPVFLFVERYEKKENRTQKVMPSKGRGDYSTRVR